MHLTTLWQCLPRLETGNLLAKSMGKVFVRATRPILPAVHRGGGRLVKLQPIGGGQTITCSMPHDLERTKTTSNFSLTTT